MDLRTINGRHGTFRVDARDRWVGRSLLAYGEYAEAELALLRRALPAGGTVVVAGAHLGALAVPLAQSAGRLLAFEPRAALAALLAENFAGNDLFNAIAYGAALGAEAGELIVPALPDTQLYNSGGVALTAIGAGDTVAVHRLDDLTLSRLDLLTADVEGMELDVLRGSEATLSRHRPILYLEADRPERTPALLDWLAARGWTAFWHAPPLFNPRNHAGRRDDVLRNNGRPVLSFNLLCLPPGVTRPDLTDDLLPALPGDDHLIAMARAAQPSPPPLRTDKRLAHYLFLPHMAPRNLEPRRADPVPPGHGADSLLSGDVLLSRPDWRALLAQWLGAVAVLGLDLTDCRYSEPPAGCARVTLDDVIAAVLEAGASVEEADHVDGRIYIVARADGRAQDRRWVRAHRHCVVIRTGAHGDGLMAGSILPQLRARGWTITLACNAAVHEALRADPHVDGFIRLPDHVKLAGDQLLDWHAALARRFDRVINLTWMVEGHLLPEPHQAAYHFPAVQRRALLSGSYLDAHHRAAGLEPAHAVRFYPDELEAQWARGHAATLGPFALVALRGSGPHKWWPHWPHFIARLLAATTLQVVLSGDAAALDLEAKVLDALEGHGLPTGRVHSLVATGSIRRVMALARHADLVVGPETGVLNAVCLEPMAKVVLLSHSAPSNLSDDWVHAHAVRPPAGAAPCHPCHRLRHAAGDCPVHLATGAALCAGTIMPDQVLAASLAMLEQASGQRAFA